MVRDPRAFLWDVRDSADAIAQFTHSRDLNDYLGDPMLRAAVERKLEIIGEALAQLSKIDPQLAAQIPELREAVGMRNVLIHGYAVADDEIVWRTVQVSVPALRESISEMLEKLADD